MSEHPPLPPASEPEPNPVLSAVNYFAAALLLALTVLVLTGVI